MPALLKKKLQGEMIKSTTETIYGRSSNLGLLLVHPFYLELQESIFFG